MSHIDVAKIELDQIVNVEPLKTDASFKRMMYFCVAVGVFTMSYGLYVGDPYHVWAAYYTNLIFWMGLAAGSCVIPAIFQIVRAAWSPPVRRLAEANLAFLPYAFLLFLVTYFGREYIFPWAREPMPGREWWMQADFVYLRFTVLLGLLFLLMYRYIRMSLRGDIGLLKERAADKDKWSGWPYDAMVMGWGGAASEVKVIQPKLSWNAPVLIIAYAVIYSLFAFEMIMAMDTIWYSNMFGGFIFIGNIYLGWAVLCMSVTYYTSTNSQYAKVIRGQQFWDLGKLTFGFCILWAYLFFSQFLPQWYGNLPEETQWLILRTREYPWKGLGWAVLGMSFILPFILLLSRDIKKTPIILSTVCLIIFIGMWLERYILVMPQISPDFIPFSAVELGIFFGFLGAYVLSISNFLSKYPFLPLSHPLTYGETDW